MQRRNNAIPKYEFMLMLRLGSLHLGAESLSCTVSGLLDEGDD